MKPRRTRSRGVTLVEVMIVVAIVGVLAVIAVVAYRRKVTSAKMSEATHMIENIRGAQETYKAEMGSYADISSSLTSFYPNASPGKVTTAWGATCAVCKAGADWSMLTVQPDGPVQFGYSTLAGTSATPPLSKGAAISVNGTAVDLSALNGKSWYVVQARGDTNGDGVYCNVFGTSASGDLMVENEGE